MSAPRELSRVKVFTGTLIEYEHDSTCTHSPMRFALYLPTTPRPLPLFFLPGHTYSHLRFPETSVIGLKKAAELGIALAFSDTSPRGLNFPDFLGYGNGSSFYLDATKQPWRDNFQMYSYLKEEWIPRVLDMLGADPTRKGIFGHSMGGHGAMVLALKNPGLFQSVSAIAPVSSPSSSPQISEIFELFLGPDESQWAEFDSTELVKREETAAVSIRVDIADSDELADLLKTDVLESVCKQYNRHNITFHHHAGFSHDNYFVSSVCEDVLAYHYSLLTAP